MPNHSRALKARLKAPDVPRRIFILSITAMNRAFSADGLEVLGILGRCPRLEWERAVGAKQISGESPDPLSSFLDPERSYRGGIL